MERINVDLNNICLNSEIKIKDKNNKTAAAYEEYTFKDFNTSDIYLNTNTQTLYKKSLFYFIVKFFYF